MIWFLWLNLIGIVLGVMLTLFMLMLDDPRRISGRKRGKR
jgi:hypothetical protein